MSNVSIVELTDFTIRALKMYGVNEEDARLTADVLVTTDTFGVKSHGTKNLYPYILKIQAGGLDPKAVPTVIREGPGWAILDGQNALGMVSSCKAMQLAIQKAKETGIAYVGVCGSCHFGAAGYYANMAAKVGMIGISMSNTDPNMAIPNSAGVAIGNNPFSFAIPRKNGKSVFLDIALSNVAALKVIMAKESGTPIPDGWLIGADGHPCSDPSTFPEKSFLQPMAAHKGYGLAVLVEVLASVLTGAGILSQVASWNLNLPKRNLAGHAFLALNVEKMLPGGAFSQRVEHMIRELKNAPRADSGKEILIPGEPEWRKREEALASGQILLTDAMEDNMQKLMKITGLSLHRSGK